MTNSPILPVAIRLDCPTGQIHGILLSGLARIIFESLSRKCSCKPLAEVAEITSGGTPSKRNIGYWNGTIPWAAPRDLKPFVLENTTSHVTDLAVLDRRAKLNAPPSTLIVTRGMILTRYVPVVHCNFPLATNQDIRVVRTKDSSLQGLYLSAVLLGAERNLYKLVTDSTAGQRRIETHNLTELPVPVADPRTQALVGEFVSSVSRSMAALVSGVSAIPYEIAQLAPGLRKWADIAIRVDTVQQLHKDVDGKLRSLLRSKFMEITKDAKWLPMQEVAPLTRRRVEISNDRYYPELGVRCHGKGTFHKPSISGFHIGNKKLYQMSPGDLVFNNVFAWEGAIAVVQEKDAGRFGSHRFIACVPEGKIATADFLRYFFLTKEGLETLGKASPGGAGRNRTLGLKSLAQIKVPLVSIEKQREFDQLQGFASKLFENRKVASQLLNALIPASLANLLVEPESTGIEKSSDDKSFPAFDSSTSHIAIASFVVDQLWEQNSFGRTKLEKLTHLIEHQCNLDLTRVASRMAAGPADFMALLTAEKNAAALDWFTVFEREGRDGRNRYEYMPGQEIQSGVNEARKLLGNQFYVAQQIIDLMRPLQTRTCEVIATLYASWNDFLLDGKTPSDEEIIRDVRQNWHPEKEKIPLSSWKRGLQILRKNDLVPKGTGKRVIRKS